jgi:ABC-type nitrate/sulfonate/bicarbonate transport system permease component
MWILDAYRILISGQYARDAAATLESIAWSVALAVIAGVLGAVALFKLPRFRRVIDPILTSYYAVPVFIFYPLFVVLFGLSRISLVAIAFLFSVVAMMLSALNGLERIPAVLLKAGRVHRLSRFDELRFITLPASLPYIFTGIKQAIAYATVGVLAGEFLYSGEGIGHRIAFVFNNFQDAVMYALMLLLLVSVGGLNMVLYAWEKRLYRRRGLL